MPHSADAPYIIWLTMAAAPPPTTDSPWVVDPLRDFVVYWLVALAVVALGETFADEKIDKGYRRWLKGTRRKPRAGAKAVCVETVAPVRELYVWNRPGGYAVRVIARADLNKFVVMVEEEHFQAEVTVGYDVDSATMEAASVERFVGDRHKAIELARHFCEIHEDDECDSVQESPDSGSTDFDSIIDFLGSRLRNGVLRDALFGTGPNGRGCTMPIEPEHKMRVAAIVSRLADASSSRKDEPRNPDDDRFLSNNPDALWAIRDGFIEQVSAGGRADLKLVLAWQSLLEAQLEEIRFKAERNHGWALSMIDRYQADLLAMAHNPDVDINTWQALVIALDRAKIEISSDVRAASLELAGREAGLSVGASDIMRSMEEIVETGGGDPFRIASHLFDAMTMMPPDFASIAVMMVSDAPLPALRDVLPLILLAPDPSCRLAAAAALEQMAAQKRLTPAGLRRLIALRSWIPESERRTVDQAIRRARLAGVDCAPWPSGQVKAVQATIIDGSGCQSLVASAKDGSRQMFTGILIKLGFGVRDVIAERSLLRREVQIMMAGVTANVLSQPVAREYLDRMVQHALWTGVAAGHMPPLGLLEVAEVLGAAEWRAQSLDPEAEVSRLLAEAALASTLSINLADALKRSAGWPLIPGLADSWFEDDKRARDISTRHARNRKKAVAAVLDEVIEPRRMAWAERLVWMALWAKAGGVVPGLPSWQDFALVASALYEAKPLAGIPLMGEIARQTVERLA